MINKIIKKIKRINQLSNEGFLPETAFNVFYQNEKLKNEDFNQPVLTNIQANEWLKEKILSGKPFLTTRFGNGELYLLCNQLYNKLLNRKQWSTYTRQLISRDLGWDGKVEEQDEFYNEFLKSVSHIDGIGIWYNHGEQVMANYICPEATLFELMAYEPFFYNVDCIPWTLALAGKKVLVVHPYKQSITDQYSRKEKLFSKEVLPDFELSCYIPFTTYNDEWKQYPDSNTAFQKMKAEILALDFDVALIACAQFGLPLGAEIKKSGRQAIHIGGALQLFFGIIGKRWESPLMPHSKYFNENWKRPYPDEIPTDPRVLKFSDDGCYW